MSFKLQNKIKFISILVGMIFYYGLTAQERSPVFYLPGVPQASLENPAIQNRSGKLAIGIPVLSGVYINVNSNMALDYLFSEDFSYSFQRFYDALDDDGKTQAAANVSVFFASLKHNDYTFSISVSEKVSSNGNFDREIIRLIRDGLIDFYGTNQSVGNAFFQFRHYKELGIGIAKKMWDGFDIGIRPKLLFGKYFLDTKDFDLMLETDTQNRELRMVPQGNYFMSGPLSYNKSFRAKIFPGDYFFQPKNLGFAFDAGMVLKTNNAMEWSVSLLDIGFIGFGHNVFDMKMARPWHYPEYMLYQSHTPKAEGYMEPREALKIIADSVSFLLEVEDADSGMASILPMKINAGGKYFVSEKTAFGVNNQFTWYRRQPINMASVFAYQKLGNWLEMAGSVSLYNLSDVAPGFSASCSSQRVQFFLATNNILGFIHPSSSKHLNLCFGMNFLFDTQ